jgi:hypothetical protein
VLCVGIPHYLFMKRSRCPLFTPRAGYFLSAIRGGRGEEVLVLNGARVLRQLLEYVIFAAASKRRVDPPPATMIHGYTR